MSAVTEQTHQLIAYLGLGLVLVLAVTATAAVFGVPWAWQATSVVVMIAAVLLGIREGLYRGSVVQIGAAVLLVGGGGYGIVVGATGGAPFQDWTVLGPVAVGVALTFFVEDAGSRQN